jgi:flavin-dependent dehydrogenase
MLTEPALDVAVIGGGPAGSTAAALLAADGFRVAVFEKETFPRFHIGESLLPFNLDMLRRLGVADEIDGRFVHKYGARLVSGDGSIRSYIRFDQGAVPGYPMAYQVVRSEFDELLLRNAARKGARVLEGRAVVEASHDHREGCVVTARDRSGTVERHRARFLLDASGRDAFLASRRGLRTMDPKLRKAAVFAHYEGVPRAEGRDAGDIVLVFLRDGWFWVIPLPDGRTSVGLVADGATLKRSGASPEELLDEAILRCPAARDLLRDARRVSKVWTASDYCYQCRDVVGNGYLLLGDAAAFLDPVFSTGVWLAMSSAGHAADALGAALRSRSPDALAPAAFVSYERAVTSHVRSYRAIVERFYRPGFLDVFLRPEGTMGVREAVTSLLAGLFDPTPVVRFKLRLFYALVDLQMHLRLLPRIELPAVFEGVPPRGGDLL